MVRLYRGTSFAKYQILISDLETIFLFGPRIDYLIYQDSYILGKYDNTECANYGISSGIGFKYAFSNGVTSAIEVRYNHDLSDLYRANNNEIYNRTIDLIVGINLTGNQIPGFSGKGHSDSVTSVCFSPDGKYIVSGSLDKTIKLRLTKLNLEEIGSLLITKKEHQHIEKRELIKYRYANLLCIKCGNKLNIWAKLTNKKECKYCR